MRGIRVIAAGLLAAVLLAGPVCAQMRPMPGYGAPPNPLIFLPRPKISPSFAVRRAMNTNPGAKALGVVPNGAGFNVRLKQGNRVFLFPVPGN